MTHGSHNTSHSILHDGDGDELSLPLSLVFGFCDFLSVQLIEERREE